MICFLGSFLPPSQANGLSMYFPLQAALLEFLAATTGTWLVSPDFWGFSGHLPLRWRDRHHLEKSMLRQNHLLPHDLHFFLGINPAISRVHYTSSPLNLTPQQGFPDGSVASHQAGLTRSNGYNRGRRIVLDHQTMTPACLKDDIEYTAIIRFCG